MRTLDLSPLYRSFIGFDRLASMVDDASQNDPAPNYPPYNIEKLEDDNYQITLAVAGFSNNDVQLVVEKNTLTVTAKKVSGENDKSRNFLHKGISERNFERKFQLGDHVNVTGAELNNGLLNISLERVIPESQKPRKIAIGTQSAA